MWLANPRKLMVILRLPLYFSASLSNVILSQNISKEMTVRLVDGNLRGQSQRNTCDPSGDKSARAPQGHIGL